MTHVQDKAVAYARACCMSEIAVGRLAGEYPAPTTEYEGQTISGRIAHEGAISGRWSSRFPAIRERRPSSQRVVNPGQMMLAQFDYAKIEARVCAKLVADGFVQGSGAFYDCWVKPE